MHERLSSLGRHLRPKNRLVFRRPPLRRAGFLLLTILIGLSASFHSALADKKCTKNLWGLSLSANVAETRSRLVDQVRSQSLPGYLRNTATGPLPIIQINPRTLAEFKSLISHSFSYFIELHPTSNYDHGGVRVGEAMIDLFLPGGRLDNGEINETGISWKTVDAYMAQRQEDSRRIMELVIPLSPNELKTAEYYHRVRRAAIFRARWAFHKSADASWGRHPNILWSGAEDCFSYPIAGRGKEHIGEMIAKLQELGIADVDRYMASPGVALFLAKARQAVLAADWRDRGVMNYLFVFRPGLLDQDTNVRPPGALTAAEQLRAASYLVGIDATRQYLELMEMIGLTEVRDKLDLNNRHAAAVFVWDNYRESERAFLNATYDYRGHSTGIYWNPETDVPILAP